jgi:hypothetical protein
VTFENELRNRLHNAVRRVGSGSDDDAEKAVADTVIARRRVQRRQRAAVLVAAAAVLLIAGAVPAVAGRWLDAGAPVAASSHSSAVQQTGAPASHTGGSTPSASSAPSASATASSVARAGCPSSGQPIPAGTNTKPTIDVDGDGRPDTAFISTQPDPHAGFTFGVRTASGGLITASMGLSGSPVERSVLFADVTGRGEVIALASDGRQVQLWAVSACRLIPMQNIQGQQYLFDLGFTGYGTGVGCADANGDGLRDLLGLRLVTDPGGTPVSIERTIIRLNGPHASNGPRFTLRSPTPAQAELATSITCGDLTMAANGVSSGP